MKLFYADHFELPLPAGHRFPMAKYRLLREAVLASGIVEASALEVPAAASDVELLRVHTPDYLRRVVAGELAADEVRRLGFPWSPELVERSRRSVGGTLGACRSALERGCGVNLAGGTHHAFADRGQGYCVFNDAAVAARAMQAEGRAKRVAIVDCDVHQGDGTASIFRDDPSVFTFSIHGRRNYPLEKRAGDLDVALEDGAGDGRYLAALAAALERLAAAGPFDLAIYLAGADPFAGDRLGRLALSREGLAERDRAVFGFFRAAGTPVAAVMAGGYAPEVGEIVAIHLETVTVAVETFGRASAALPAALSPRRRGAGSALPWPTGL